ncbi:regulatory protein RecX [Neolewinella antarctica]|uniref:Regulatory protein RecX n=1 Tax=Neolewinella antarctica TaxID=442734 RepID=A0ABX0XD06_9BACT|nr:regulatory protein RecX [Neolewinella antarctica]NJC26788.1 regulatory protein [Neolewinella antarctica]
MYYRPKQEKKVVYTRDQALEALQHFCAYQDRCHKEARQKLRELHCFGHEAEEVICDLIAEKYLDDERFARSFARGKFKIKRWGRMKITRELRQRDISAYCIKKGLSEIEPEAYQETMEKELLRREKIATRGLHPYLKRKKLADYMFQRGYESYLTWEAINRLEL